MTIESPPDLDLIDRQMIMAIEKLGNGGSLDGWLSDREDRGRDFSIGLALTRAAQLLIGDFGDDDWQIVKKTFERKGLSSPPSRQKGACCNALIQALKNAP
jgi:hypothetical protein